MKISLAIAFTILPFSLPLIPAQSIAQTQSPCPSGSTDCLQERFRQDSQYNPNLYFRTPQQVNQGYYQNRILNTCQANNSATCNRAVPAVESLQESDRARTLRDAQEQRREQLLSN